MNEAPTAKDAPAGNADASFAELTERRRGRIRRYLHQHPRVMDGVVVLAYVHGLSHGELAGKLGVPLGTVKSWVRRGLISLQECMG